MQTLKEQIVKKMREVADKIECGTCELSESEALDMLSIIGHEVMSKESACMYLNLSRSKFDDLVREGKLPKGRKRTGFKEIAWYKDELDACVKNLKK